MKRLFNLVFYLTIFLIPFYFIRFSFLGYKTNIFEVLVLITFLICVYLKSFDLTIEQVKWGPVWPYIFLVFTGVSVVFAEDKTQALGILKGWFIIPIILYWVIINIFNKKNILTLSYPVFFSVMVVAVWAILQKMKIITTLFYQTGDQSFSQYLESHVRVFGPFESPNYLAMFLVPAIFVSLGIFNLISDKKIKIISGALLFLPIIAVILSGSRAGILALIASGIVYLLIKEKRKIEISSVLSTSLIVAVLLFLIVWIAKIGINPGADSIRIEIYKYSIEIIKNNWFWGVGLGEFQKNITDLAGITESFKTHALPYALHPHNIFLAMWLNVGLLGLFSFLVLLGYFFVNAIKTKIFVRSILVAAMTAIIVHGLFDTTYYKNDLSAIFWLLFAVLIVSTNEKKYAIKQN